MKHYKRHLIATAAVCILGVSATVVNAETVTTKTVVSTKHLNGVDRVNFASFDLNGDGILSMSEVGERLFYAFDMDGNEVIDNIEMNKKSVMTIIPMEKQTFKFVDDNNDGKTDEGAYTYETFIEKSKLMRFDKDIPHQTEFVKTMFFTDYLLKFFTTGTEISSFFPFDMRSTCGLLERLPLHLRKVLEPLHHSEQIDQKAHRFWIESEQIPLQHALEGDFFRTNAAFAQKRAKSVANRQLWRKCCLRVRQLR